jgi:hypothetical protein
MSSFTRSAVLAIGLILLLFCPFAMAFASLAADVPINDEAGRGGLLILKLRLEDGTELPFLVDTGSPVTFFDVSLESRLGHRLGTRHFRHFGVKHKSNIYAAPKLYLNGSRLLTGGRVWIDDFKELHVLSGQRTMGIIGMDCLRHYCLQLDFEEKKLRFLNPDRMDATQLGKRYPIRFSFPWRGPFIHERGFLGQNQPKLLIDTGYAADGALTAEARQSGSLDNEPEYASRSECVWTSGTYTNLLIGHDGNLIGLRFLARHLVTLDFPNRSMYLKQTISGPLDGDRFIQMENTAGPAADSAQRFFERLKKTGRLPRWMADEKAICEVALRFHYFEIYPITATINVRKSQDTSVYCYDLTQAAKDTEWALQRAWLMDQNGRVIEEFPVR